MRVGSDGRRYFGDGDTCDEGHRPGDRHEGIGSTLEWTGDMWAPVCVTCDVTLSARDGSGRLVCGACGGHAKKAVASWASSS